jgi:hypothetical protein
MSNQYKCCICNGDFWGYGNNPSPLKSEGRCCNVCNDFVIAERLRLLLGIKKKKKVVEWRATKADE